MNCSDVDRALLDEPLPSRLPSQAQEHLRECRRCREFLRALNSSVSPESPSPTTLRRIQQAISADLQPVHPVASKRSIVGALVAIYACIVAVAAYRFGASALSVMGLLPAGAIFGTLAISAALLAHSLAHQMVPGSQHRIPPELLPAGIMVVLMFAVAVSFPFRDERAYWAICLGLSPGGCSAWSRRGHTLLAGPSPGRHPLSRHDRSDHRPARRSGWHQCPGDSLP